MALSFFLILGLNVSLPGIASENETLNADQQYELLNHQLEAVTISATARAFTEAIGNQAFGLMKSSDSSACEAALRGLYQKSGLKNCLFAGFSLDPDFSRVSVTPQSFQAGAAPGKSQLGKAFEYLVRLSTGQNIEPGKEKLLKATLTSLLGQRIICSDIAEPLRGVAFPIIYRRTPYLFVWNYELVKTIDKSSFQGYFFLARHDKDLQTAANSKALQNNGALLSGFVKLYANGSSDLLLPATAKNSSFKKWRADFCTHPGDYQQTLLDGLPWGVEIDNHLLFCRQIPETDWVAVRFQPKPTARQYGNLLFVINLFWSIIPVLGICHRLLFGHWPVMNLKSRLIIVLALAICLPVSFLTITFLRYQQGFSTSFKQNLQEKLKLSNEEFDHGHHALEADYQSTFARTINSREIIEDCKSWQNAPEAFAETIKAKFVNERQNLPITAIALYDQAGTRYFASFEAKEARATQRFYDFYYDTMVSIVRKMLLKSFPEGELLPVNIPGSFKSFKMVFEMLIGLKLDFEQEKRLGETMWFHARNDATGFIMGVIQSGSNYTGVIVFFSQNGAKAALFKRICEKLRLERNSTTSLVFEKTPHGQVCLNPLETRSDMEKIETIVKMADTSNGNLYTINKDFMYLMQPSRKFVNTSFLSFTSTAEMQKALNGNLTTFLIFLAACLLILFFSSSSLYQRFMNPILATTALMDRISKGDLDGKLEFERNDEFGELKIEVDEMLNGLAQRKKLTAILSDQLVALLDNAGSSETMAQPASFSGIALVSDIRQFTTISETESAGQITAMLNAHFAEMASAITSNGGKIYKFIGDAIEAIFETNESHSFAQASQNAVKASFEMLARMQRINVRRRELGLFTYKIGIGLASGTCLAGLIGDTTRRQDLTIIGSAIEKANRLEAMSKMNPALPIIMEKEIATASGFPSVLLSDVCGKGPESVYTFKEFPITADFQTREAQNPGEVPATATKQRNAWFSAGQTRAFAFVIGSLFTLLPFISLQQISRHKLLSEFATNQETLENNTNSFITLLKSKGAPVYFTEKLLADFSHELAAQPALNTPELLKKLVFCKIQPEKMLISRLKKGSGISDQLHTECRFGINDSQMPEFVELQEILFKKAHKFINLPPGQLFSTHQDARPQVRAIKNETMLEIDQLFLGRELAYKVFAYAVNGQRKAFFWCPLLKNSQPDGILFITMPYSCVEEAAIFNLTRSQNWPDTRLFVYGNDNRLLAESSGASNTENTVIAHKFEKIDFGNMQLTVHFKSFIKTPGFSAMPAAIWVVFAIFFLWLWYLTIYRQQAFAASIGRQFFLAMTFMIMIPATILMYYLFCFEYLEKSSISWQQTRKLSQRLDRLERQPQVAFPIWLERLRRFINSESIIRASTSSDAPGSSAISEIFNANINKESAPQPLPICIARAICIDKTGKSWINFSVAKGETGDLAVKSVLAGFCRLLFEAVLGGSITTNSGIGVQAQQEITLDAMLPVIRAMFGAEVSAEVIANINYPSILAAVTEKTAIIAAPIPGSGSAELFLTVISEVPGIMPLLKAVEGSINQDIRCFAKPVSCYGHSNLIARGDTWQSASDLIHQTAFTKTGILKREATGTWQFIAMTRYSSIIPQAIIMAVAPVTDLIRKIETGTSVSLAVLLAITLIIYVVVLRIARSIAGPVEQMILAVKLLRESEFKAGLPVNTKDEIGFLCEKFNAMAHKIQQRDFIRTFVSDHARRFVDSKGHLHGETRSENLLLMFIETASSRHGNEENVFTQLAHLQQNMKVLCKEIYNHGGDIDKVIGHKLLVSFAGKPHEALASLQNFLEALHKRSDKSDMCGFSAGIHYGKAASCLLGIGQQQDYTLIGDAVNTAARIHAAAKESGRKILFSEAAARLAPSQTDFVHACTIELKGKSGSFNLFAPAMKKT